jgi:hypothetical protein
MKSTLICACLTLFFSSTSYGQELLHTCEYAAEVHSSDNPIVVYPAKVGGCIGHLAGYGVGLVVSTPFAFLGAMEGVEPIVAGFGEAGNRSFNYIFGMPGSLLIDATGK